MQSQPSNLTEHSKKLLNILRGLYGWSSRPVIADKLGRKQLNAYDVVALEKLAVHGLIEIRKVKRGTSKGHVWEYRVIEPEERDTMPDV